ncbi:MAG: lytic murein transglycosylase [Desulfobacca sp.]|uniref:lytic murein transglycosylase n=1 Tax=Desulfobacca sp. TaxID=2067990 RepID=UPI0040490E02
MSRRLWWVMLLLAVLPGSALALEAAAPAPPMAFTALQAELVRRGFERDYIQKLFNDPRAEFLPKVVTRIAYQRKEKKADYTHFLTTANVEKGRRFLAEHQRFLSQAETAFGVPKEIIVAIMTVESDLGNKTGNYPVFNVFSSLAVMDTPEVIKRLSLNPALMARLQKKAAWGRSELAALLTYCRQNRLDPLSIKGSWAGAFGYSQFLPSSILRSGADGNRDGKVDLFTHEDAIYSIGNYLQKAGLRKNKQASWSRAIYAYNNSEPYVETVLTLASWY